jgi:hypothetical protein
VSQELQEGSNISKAVDMIMMNMGMQIMEQLLLVNELLLSSTAFSLFFILGNWWSCT